MTIIKKNTVNQTGIDIETKDDGELPVAQFGGCGNGCKRKKVAVKLPFDSPPKRDYYNRICQNCLECQCIVILCAPDKACYYNKWERVSVTISRLART